MMDHPKSVPGDELVEELVAEFLTSKKYREADLCADTVRDVVTRELAQHRGRKDAVKAVRKKLHNVVAPYLGDPDYPAALSGLSAAFATGGPAEQRRACAEVLAVHASTRERLAILDGFYQRIFAVTGQPEVLLDLACGLNPLTFPWMGLPTSLRYHAYDLHGARVGFINGYFQYQGLAPLAEARDILVSPPQVDGQVAFLFKEAHRIEQRAHGSNRALWDALSVRYLAVSLPTSSLNQRYNLIERQRQLVREILGDRPWPVIELLFDSELVFCIDKSGDH